MRRWRPSARRAPVSTRRAAPTATWSKRPSLVTRFRDTGQGPWREMWEAARRFVVSGVGRFPDPCPDAACPVCQQDLDDAARERMASFEEFVRSDLSDRIAARRSDLRRRVDGLPDVAALRARIENSLDAASDDVRSTARRALDCLAQRERLARARSPTARVRRRAACRRGHRHRSLRRRAERGRRGAGRDARREREASDPVRARRAACADNAGCRSSLGRQPHRDPASHRADRGRQRKLGTKRISHQLQSSSRRRHRPPPERRRDRAPRTSPGGQSCRGRRQGREGLGDLSGRAEQPPLGCSIFIAAPCPDFPRRIRTPARACASSRRSAVNLQPRQSWRVGMHK